MDVETWPLNFWKLNLEIPNYFLEPKLGKKDEGLRFDTIWLILGEDLCTSRFKSPP